MATYGRKQAIRDKCIDCCGGFIREVRKCTAYTCPLWRFRMGREAAGELVTDNDGCDEDETPDDDDVDCGNYE